MQQKNEDISRPRLWLCRPAGLLPAVVARRSAGAGGGGCSCRSVDDSAARRALDPRFLGRGDNRASLSGAQYAQLSARADELGRVSDETEPAILVL